MWVCAAPTGRVLLFWSENGYRFCPIWSGIGYGFSREPRECMKVQFTFQFQISKKGREICEFEMHLKNFFGWNSNLCNDVMT